MNAVTATWTSVAVAWVATATAVCVTVLTSWLAARRDRAARRAERDAHALQALLDAAKGLRLTKSAAAATSIGEAAEMVAEFTVRRLAVRDATLRDRAAGWQRALLGELGDGAAGVWAESKAWDEFLVVLGVTLRETY